MVWRSALKQALWLNESTESVASPARGQAHGCTVCATPLCTPMLARLCIPPPPGPQLHPQTPDPTLPGDCGENAAHPNIRGNTSQCCSSID
ncbi:hypothetical protein AAFF_G00397730 [Aldrovandia affinis]|uniref:Uncharacterized protein n=1 Tax=Aldrovandia affinis TaxID=143900 RepID=A0AAD7SD49_9TELE|nr:hypothetical protein AAFF_G00397730 [Aldrovandia affinis]